MPDTTSSPLHRRTVALVKAIPKGRILTYGKVAEMIGAKGCARHVSYILSSSSRKYGLPWHRVTSAGGKIASFAHDNEQVFQLKREGVLISPSRAVDLAKYEWRPRPSTVRKLLAKIPPHAPARAL